MSAESSGDVLKYIRRHYYSDREIVKPPFEKKEIPQCKELNDLSKKINACSEIEEILEEQIKLETDHNITTIDKVHDTFINKLVDISKYQEISESDLIKIFKDSIGQPGFFKTIYFKKTAYNLGFGNLSAQEIKIQLNNIKSHIDRYQRKNKKSIIEEKQKEINYLSQARDELENIINDQIMIKDRLNKESKESLNNIINETMIYPNQEISETNLTEIPLNNLFKKSGLLEVISDFRYNNIKIEEFALKFGLEGLTNLNLDNLRLRLESYNEQIKACEELIYSLGDHKLNLDNYKTNLDHHDELNEDGNWRTRKIKSWKTKGNIYSSANHYWKNNEYDKSISLFMKLECFDDAIICAEDYLKEDGEYAVSLLNEIADKTSNPNELSRIYKLLDDKEAEFNLYLDMGWYLKAAELTNDKEELIKLESLSREKKYFLDAMLIAKKRRDYESFNSLKLNYENSIKRIEDNEELNNRINKKHN